MTEKKKQHPWRICPVGEHWVKEHTRHVKKSEKYPNGATIVSGHCRKNSSNHEKS